ncbi:MAG: VOC family protein [Rhodococcus sp. (in: high G+C Gram-positive bacteria)]
MSTLLNPYISFRGEARAALEFYQSVFGGELTISTFGENGMGDDPGLAEQTMHGQLTASNGLTLMCADTPPGMDFDIGTNISVSLSGDDEAELTGYWSKLAVDARNTMGLDKAPWGDTFGMLTDKFGVAWMVNIAS